MSEPEAMRDDEVVAVLNDLIQLDRDAIEGYTIAINTIRNHGHREALVAFRHDHTRHLEALSVLLRARGTQPGRASHITGPLGAAVSSLGAARTSDTAILLAFRAIERQTRDRYRESVTNVDVEDVGAVLRRHAQDEEIHYRWLESSLEDLGYRREIADLELGVAAMTPLTSDRVTFRLEPEERREPLS